MKSQYKSLGNKLRQVIDDIPIEKGSNIVISGHGGTLSYDLKNGFKVLDVFKPDSFN